MSEDIRAQVRLKYAQAITTKSGCCGSKGCWGGSENASSCLIKAVPFVYSNEIVVWPFADEMLGISGSMSSPGVMDK